MSNEIPISEKTREAHNKYVTALKILKDLDIEVVYADTGIICVKENYVFSVDGGLILLKVGGEEYGFVDPHTNPSYFTFKPNTPQYTVCVNYPKMCKMCKEPECDGRGRVS